MFTFDIIGITPILHFFNYQQKRQAASSNSGVAYLSSHRCSLDAILRTIDHTDFDPTWQTDELAKTVVNFWLGNLDSVTHWQDRLKTADHQTILVTRIAHTHALRHELEALFHD
ncbi:MAG: hypothetical protein HC805_00215 [Alkalinema sp. RL_2_19]|nr:hypothetical protein [Alkalinema sp. RL_2_19]